MNSPLLETKMHVPARRRGLVARSRLTERLSRTAASSLTLVSAPAGFGKTTVLTQWRATASADGWSVAWLSLDQRDNDPAVFWTYVISALRTVRPAIGAQALALLQPPAAPVEDVLAGLLNELHALADDVVLVLDDYHVIDAPEVHAAMAFFLDHLPEQLHLVIAGRTDPPLPLPRLRARGRLLELRAADLRFTPEEVGAYLHDGMGLALTTSDVMALEQRTEGWIAALQLAALSMQGRDDVTAFIAGFAGDDRYVVDYLAEEVLLLQPEHVQQFLLQTSILDRLAGPLCDAVTGQTGGRVTLTALERGNLFLVPLDDRRQWYRYHQLFADVLQAHLLDRHPELVAVLHRRASDWYAGHDQPAEAIRHALDAEDHARAADLVEQAIPALRRTRREAAMRDWLRALPDEVVRARPVLNLGLAGAMLTTGEIAGVEGRLREVELVLADGAAAEQPGSDVPGARSIGDAEELGRIPALIELYRAALALARQDGRATVEHARRALGRAQEDPLAHAAAAGLLGLAYWAGGDLAAAHLSYSDCVAGLHRAGHTADTLGAAVALADIRITQGRLGDALHTYEQALRDAPPQDGVVLRGTADMYVGMSEVLLERDDLAGARQALARSEELGEHLGLPQNRYRSKVAQARIRVADGDHDGGLELLDEAERVYVSDFFPDVRPIRATKARLHVARGSLADAVSWAQDSGVSAGDVLSYLREYEHITLARVLLARDAADGAHPRNATDRTAALHEAADLLDRLQEAAERGARTGSLIELLVLQALAHQARGDGDAATEALERALALAEPQGYVRLFVNEGAPMSRLLHGLAKRRVAGGYARRLQAAFPTTSAAARDRPDGAPRLVEPLSERELGVLRLLGSDLDGPGMARELSVSLNTIRTHTQRIYTKLGVNNRRAAVRRAKELDLLRES